METEHKNIEDYLVIEFRNTSNPHYNPVTEVKQIFEKNNDNYKGVIFYLNKLLMINSRTIGAMFVAHRKMREENKKVHLVYGNNKHKLQMEQLIQRFMLKKFFTLNQSMDEIIESYALK